jgi:hypothetical protein
MIRTRLCGLAAVLAIASAGLVPPVLAAQQEGVVNVNIENVANEIAKNLSVDVSQVPVNVQVPVGVAANVCDVDANVLASQKQGDQAANCTAKSTNQALNQVVQKQLKQ